jgi:hypothetical protein
VVSCIRTTVENAMTFALGGKAGDPENDSVLNQPLIDRMMDVLLKNSHVNTSTMLQPTAN